MVSIIFWKQPYATLRIYHDPCATTEQDAKNECQTLYFPNVKVEIM
jgi:hypothetical protein